MSYLKSTIVLISFLTALYLGHSLKPSLDSINLSNQPDFEKIIPMSFERWHVDSDIPMVLGDPELESKLNIIYSQNVSRTYVNENDQRIMLSVAYGSDQRDSMQVHKPEVCYPAQGFVVNSVSKGELNIGFKKIPATYLDTAMNSRREFVTYWILVGNQVVDGGMQRKLKQLEFGLRGVIPDGLLFRVSSIGLDGKKELLLQKKFIISLLRSVNKPERHKLIGQ